MTMRQAMTDGFKYSPDGIKVVETVKGKSYDIPDDRFKVWAKTDKFKECEVEPKQPPTAKKSMPGAKENK